MRGVTKILYNVVIVTLLAMVVTACSTTRRLSVDDPLYTGVKRISITSTDVEKMPTELKSQVKEAVNVAPNNSLISPSLRHPFPVGLWVYNNWDSEAKGMKGWLYKKLVEEPVLLSDVRPELRVKMIDEILENNGYINSSLNYE